MDYNDIITYEEKAMLMISDDTTWGLFEDSRYMPIVEALRKGPMTVRDLEVEYNNIVARKIDEMPLEAKEKRELKDKTKRKGKTLYKYLDVLEKNGLVVQAGKRVRMGQTASETLYGRSAKLFLMDNKEKIKLAPEEIKKVIPVLGKLISLDNEKQSLSNECLTKFFRKILTKIITNRDQITKDYSNEITQVATEVNYNDLSTVIQLLDFYLIIKHAPELMKELEKCFR
ncbi:MAG: hypothetical protein FK733_07635 [Asgard group archaeon]|nr:hypothetical protein [Asgard group archaeon]